jgi:hypothetical protein
MIIGGLAVALRGSPRTTKDVDAVVLVPEASWSAFLKQGKEHHFSPRIPDALPFARKSRMLLLHHRPSKLNVDISLGDLPFEYEAIARATEVTVQGEQIPLATVEDLIILKAVPGRDRDLIDIASLLNLHRDVDADYIRRHVDEFAQQLETPEIYLEVDRMLTKYLKRNRGK